MKYTLIINQKGVFDAELIGKVKLEHACLLSYLHGWHVLAKANSVIVEGRRFVWVDYGRAVEELPMLFNPHATLASRKNQLTYKMQKLRALGLIETTKSARRLYFRFTGHGEGIANSGKQTRANSVSTVTTQRDDSVTQAHDESVPLQHDDSPPTINNETSTMKTSTNEPPPQSPLQGDDEKVLAFWNSFPLLPSTKALTPTRARNLRKRLADPHWRANWREAIPKIAASSFLTGGGDQRWHADFDWFLRSDSLVKILEGKYDNRPGPPRKESVMELNIRLKAIESLQKSISTDGNYWDGRLTNEESRTYQKLERERTRILERLANSPEG